MLDIRFLRDHPDDVRRSLARRHTTAPLDAALMADERRRAILAQLETLRAERNRAGKAIGKATNTEERERLIAEQRQAAARIDELEAALREADAALRSALAQLPNLVHSDVPDGADATDNVLLRQHGEPQPFDFEPQPHWALGAALGIIDIDRAAAMAGTRMYLLQGAAAALQRTLIGWFLERHVQAGYTEIYCPAMVREEAMFVSGQLPKFRDNLYHDAEEDYWFVPTAEVPLTNLHRDEILDPGDLPLRYAAQTPCFRREKMSAGRDVRGIKRVHQFEKVEMYQFTRPQESMAALDQMLAQAEALLRDLGLTYRVLQLCSGDLGFTATLSYDLEVWAPGAQEWLEVSTLSNCTDFQARRANIRFRPEPGAPPQFVHTLNGSGLALPRILAALLETYQTAEGAVALPQVLSDRLPALARIVPLRAREGVGPSE